MSDLYIPEYGDVIWLSFNPVLGREQGGRRPALVLSPFVFNQNGLCISCPITSKEKGLHFEVPISVSSSSSGAVLSSQIKCLDWRRRNPQFIEKANQRVLTIVKLKLALLLGIDQNLLDLIHET